MSGSRLVMLNLGWKKRHISGVLFSGKTQSIQQFTPINRFHEIRKRVSLNNRAEIHSTTLLHNFWNGSHAIPLQIPFFSPKYNTIEMYFFLMLVLLRRTSFRDTFYVLYTICARGPNLLWGRFNNIDVIQ